MSTTYPQEAEIARLKLEMSGLLEKAERESRDLSRRESAQLRELERSVEGMLDDLSRQKEMRGPGARQVDAGDGPAPIGAMLGREQRMSDWGCERGRAGDAEELRGFSLGKLVRGMVTGHWADAEVEQRALSGATNAAGGFLTPEPLANSVIDRIRNQARVIEAGAQTVPMESDQLSIPRLATGVTAGWRNENAAVAESDPVFERVTFQARTLAVLTRMSYELFTDMTAAGAEIIEREMIQSLAVELDRVALRGSGTAPEPLGIKNQAGVATITNGANGATMTYGMLVNALATVQAAGFDPNASILNSRARKTLAGLIDTTNQPLRPPEFLDGHPLLVTNQVPITITTGTNTDTSEIYTGQWDQLLIGFRPQVEISVTRSGAGPAGMVALKSSSERYIDQMQIGILCWLRADIQVAHPQAFAVTTGVR